MEKVTRRWWLLASLSAPLATVPIASALGAQGLEVRLDPGNLIRISALGFQFLSGKPLDRLKSGSSVSYFAQLSLSTDGYRTVQARELTRFALSYDIWEERFSALRFRLSNVEEATRKSAPLSEAAVQNWCLEGLRLDVSQFPLDQLIWVRLELRAEDGRGTPGLIGEPGISISRLIDLFSQPARTSQDHWQLDAGPFRLSDLKRKI
jgi:hypothetical protein